MDWLRQEKLSTIDVYIKLNLVFCFFFGLFITVSGIQNKINLLQCNSVFVHHIIYYIKTNYCNYALGYWSTAFGKASDN